MGRSRAEHLQWAKDRALEYVDRGQLMGAFSSFAADIAKHPEIQNDVTDTLLTTVGLSLVLNGSAAQLREFIEGFN